MSQVSLGVGGSRLVGDDCCLVSDPLANLQPSHGVNVAEILGGWQRLGLVEGEEWGHREWSGKGAAVPPRKNECFALIDMACFGEF